MLKKVITWVRRHRTQSLVLATILILGGYFFYQRASAKPATTQLQTDVVTRGTIVAAVSESGQMASANRLPITTQASGQIKQVFVKNGDQVSAGQNILELALDQTGQQRAASAWSAYLSAQNTLNAANANLWTLQNTLFVTNQKFINDRGITNPTDAQKSDPVYIEENAAWLAAEANYKNQQNVIAQTQAALSNAWLNYQGVSAMVTAPGPGTVSDLILTSGMAITSTTNNSNVPSATTVGSVVTNNLPTATFNLSEIDVTKVKEGQKATLTLDALPGMTFTGTVVGINRSGIITSNVTNYPVVIQFDTSPDKVLPNMSVTANIVTATKDDALIVPSAAIRNNTVRVKNGNNIETVNVETGLSSDTETEIISGLSEGQTVIIGGGLTTNQTSSPFGSFRFGGGGGGAMLRGRGG